jgi:hypothetical protein
MNVRYAVLLLSAAAALYTASAQMHVPARSYKGYAILGSGTFCAVYSDDDRICAATKRRGIQHFYYNDYTHDYIASTSFDILDKRGERMSRSDSTGMKNYFTPSTRSLFSGTIAGTSECFVHPDGVVLSFAAQGAPAGSHVQFELQLRNNLGDSAAARLIGTRVDGTVGVARYSHGVCIGIAPHNTLWSVVFADSTLEITAPAGSATTGDVVIAVGATEAEMRGRLAALLRDPHPAGAAKRHWDAWMAKGKLPRFHTKTSDTDRLVEAYKRNLYAMKSAAVNGTIPADITGQFLTHGMPQLYPRDAMMCARVFLETGHPDEARSVISFWTDRRIPRKSPGEFFARYDAHGRAVDAGSGARYDEPEWDANGYLLRLLDMYHARTKKWVAPKETLFSLADFLARSIDSTGLLYEGGIVEWTGYLPTTNMICAAGLTTAARIARTMHDPIRAARYADASRTITRSLPATYRQDKHTYMALRFHGEKASDNRSITEPARDTVYLWDTTVNFGVLWGYPPTPEVERSNDFFNAHTIGLGGGMQYFDAYQDWLIGYGHDVFFFTTAAAAQYQARFGDLGTARSFIAWMTSHANAYGLMPERIYLNGTDCSEASPLSWCCGEYALAIYEMSRRINIE